MRTEIGKNLSLLECLTPKSFDLVIKYSKQITNYNENKDSFGSPSLILKLGYILKECCDITEFIMLKESDGLSISINERESISNIKYMMEKQWSYEVSTNVSKEIY